MGVVEDDIVVQNLKELRTIFDSSGGKLVKSRISPEDYFFNLTHDAPKLKFPEVGISKTIVNICELVSTLLLEDIDESSSISKVIVMIFEYYFLVGPIKFKDQGARFVNDVTFMEHFMRYIRSLCKSRMQAHKELSNTLASVETYNPISDLIV